MIDRLMGSRTTLPDGSVGFNAAEYEFRLSVQKPEQLIFSQSFQSQTGVG